MVAATASEATRALAAESKIASDLSAEAARAIAAEAVITQSVTAEVSRAGVIEDEIMAAVAQEAVERKNAITSVESKLNIEKSAREADDTATNDRSSDEVARLDTANANLSSMIDEQEGYHPQHKPGSDSSNRWA